MAKRKAKKRGRRKMKKKRAKKKPRRRKTAPVDPRLTEKRRRFVEAYMGKAAGNATEAARIAGYASPMQEGFRLLRFDAIRKAIDARVASDPAIATREDRQQFWTDAMNNAKVAWRDRLKASELLGKSQADFVERREHSGLGGAPLSIKTRVVFVGDAGD